MSPLAITAIVTFATVAIFLLVLFKRNFFFSFFRRKPTSRVSLPAEPKHTDIVIATQSPASEPEDGAAMQPAAFFPDKPSRHDYLNFESYAETLAGLIAPQETFTASGVR